jgi:thiaminase
VARGAAPAAADLLRRTRDELAAVERALASHPFPDAVAAGNVPAQQLRDFAGEQRVIIASDRRAFAHLAARFPAPPAGDLFLDLAKGEGIALGHLAGFAAWLGFDEAALDNYEPRHGAQAYTAYVAWLALNGSATDVALAFLANLSAWGTNCARMAAALRQGHGAGDDAVAFFDFFATPAPGFQEHALAVVQAGLDAGDPPARAVRASRLLQAYELEFWDTMTEVG